MIQELHEDNNQSKRASYEDIFHDNYIDAQLLVNYLTGANYINQSKSNEHSLSVNAFNGPVVSDFKRLGFSVENDFFHGSFTAIKGDLVLQIHEGYNMTDNFSIKIEKGNYEFNYDNYEVAEREYRISIIVKTKYSPREISNQAKNRKIVGDILNIDVSENNY
jgi:hypothetical protein